MTTKPDYTDFTHYSAQTPMTQTTSTTTSNTEQLSSLPQTCPRYEYAVQLLGKRWTGLLIHALMDGPRRFCELTACVEGLSDRVLSDRLRELEVEGIVERIVYPRIPVRVEYQLTEKGHALRPIYEEIQQWATRWVELPNMPEETASPE